MLKLVRRCVGMAVICLDWLFRPQPIARSEQDRRLIAQEVRNLRLYDYRGCPNSLLLWRHLHRLDLGIQYCDIRKCQVYRDELLAQCGRLHAPCLRIEQGSQVLWLDEPQQIIQYLDQRFAPATRRDAVA